MPKGIKKLENIVKTVKDVIKHAVKTSQILEDQSEIRLKCCKRCTWYNNGMCIKCGCYIKIKIKFKASKCPIGKW